MRHGVKINHLGRKTAHRKALMRNMAISLIEHKRITTTLAKAKALRVFIEPLLTKAKTDDMHNRRIVFSYLQNNNAINELFNIISPKIADRPGGYTRIIKLERRVGDAADMALIELVDFNEIYNTSAKVGEEKKKTRRGRPKKSATTESTQEPKVEAKAEEPTPATDEATSTTAE
ncbi:MAG: 50S ribosomal protein L17 [Bacteroidetes bacterium OLB11]|nr:MAG: 50S ribosomal protein L17 [Bacteroidetes bacterium OLB11]